jgi:hypothetical protein
MRFLHRLASVTRWKEADESWKRNIAQTLADLTKK